MLSTAIKRRNSTPEDYKRFSKAKRFLKNYRDVAAKGRSKEAERMKEEGFNILKDLHENIDNSTFSNLYALSFEKEGQLEMAQKIFEENLTRYPEMPTAIISYGVFLQRTAGSEKSLPYFEEAIKKLSNSYHKYKNGHEFLTDEDFKEGLSKAYLGLSISWYEKKGDKESNKNNLKKAFEYVYKAIEFDDQSDSAFSQLGHCWKAKANLNGSQYENYITRAREAWNRAKELNQARLVKHAPFKPEEKIAFITDSENENDNTQSALNAIPFQNQIDSKEFYSGKSMNMIIQCEELISNPLFQKVYYLMSEIKKLTEVGVVKPYLIRDWNEIRDLMQQGKFTEATAMLGELLPKLEFYMRDPLNNIDNNNIVTYQVDPIEIEELFESIEGTQPAILPQSPAVLTDAEEEEEPSIEVLKNSIELEQPNSHENMHQTQKEEEVPQLVLNTDVNIEKKTKKNYKPLICMFSLFVGAAAIVTTLAVNQINKLEP